tara:strand:+ start:36993 stop:37829 length:837 start_codon:yes stop_codon:yes gene_type:complete
LLKNTSIGIITGCRALAGISGEALFSSLFQAFSSKSSPKSFRKASMTKEFPLEKMDLALFENSGNKQEFSQLKDFLSFLKLYGYPKPFRFSHVETNGPLIENLSLEENLLLHSNGNDEDSQKANLSKQLEQSGNPHLVSLFNSISLKENRPSTVDDESRKALALVKALLQSGDFLFLENPEKFLGKKLLSLFIQALVYKSATTGLIVVISTRFKNIWSPHFTKRVFRNEKNIFKVSHYNQSGLDTLFKIQNAPEAEDEGLLKIVNPNSDDTEENKKAA